MSIDYLAQLEAGIRPLTIHSLSSFSWAGLRYRTPPSQLPKSLSRDALREFLISDLQWLLYSKFYCVGFPAFLTGDIWRAGNPMEQARLASRLSAVNTGKGSLEPDWTIRGVRNGTLLASRHDLTVRLDPEQAEFSSEAAVQPGHTVSLRWPKELPAASPGFYLALGNRTLDDEGEVAIVRLYFNVTAEGAVSLMRLLTGALNADDIPFRFKVFTDLSRFSRSDAAVLYVRKDCYPAVHELLTGAARDLTQWLREGTPALTKPLMPGLATAESPGDQDSFGLHRCRLVAEGLLRAFEQRRTQLRDRLEAVTERLSSAGIDSCRPYLSPGSADVYSTIEPRNARRAPEPDMEPLAVAHAIGEAIVEQAIWHRDRCSWIGAAPVDQRHVEEVRGQRYSVLGPDLYSGTSGVALFLAELYAQTGNERFGRTAIGALKHALRLARSSLFVRSNGLFEGVVGISLAATRVAVILRRSEFGLAGQALMTARRRSRADEGFDLLAGKAGRIVGCIILAKMWQNIRVLHEAGKVGRGLLESSRREGGRCSWGPPDRLHLTGLSHGAAGAAYALLELVRATGDQRTIAIVEEVFRYERQWFDTDVQNWRDFRWLPGRSRQRALSAPCACHWCHGAPGIALSRLRAVEVRAAGYEPNDIRVEAVVALNTTRRMVEAALHSGASNFSLCHGLTGNAEVLAEGSRVLGQEFSAGSELAREVARVGGRVHGSNAAHWPCGSGGGTTPGLMCGLAGIGYFYLRVHDPSIPSVLMPRAESF